jgi:hypothetical protein
MATRPGLQQVSPLREQPQQPGQTQQPQRLQQPQAHLGAPGAAAPPTSSGSTSSLPLVQLQGGSASSSRAASSAELLQAPSASSSSALRCAFEAGALPPGLHLLKDDSSLILPPGLKLPPGAAPQAQQEALVGTELRASTPRAERIAGLLSSISTHPLIWQLASLGSSQARSLGQVLQQGGAAKAKQLALAMVHLAGQLQELALMQEQDEAAGTMAARSGSSGGAALKRGSKQQLPVLPLV